MKTLILILALVATAHAQKSGSFRAMGETTEPHDFYCECAGGESPGYIPPGTIIYAPDDLEASPTHDCAHGDCDWNRKLPQGSTWPNPISGTMKTRPDDADYICLAPSPAVCRERGFKWMRVPVPGNESREK